MEVFMSKKLFLGLLLSVGLQGLNAADAGEQAAPAAPADTDAQQTLVLANNQGNRQLALPNQQQALTAQQIAAAAGNLALNTAQQAGPLVRRGATAAATLAAREVWETAAALNHRYHNGGPSETAASVGFGYIAGYIAGHVAEKLLGSVVGLPVFAVTTVLGIRFGAQVITKDRIKSCSFTVTRNNTIVYEAKNKKHVDLTTLNFNFPVTVIYTVDSVYVPHVSETVLCQNQADLNIIIGRFQAALEAGQR